MIELRRLSFAYQGRNGLLPVFEDIDLVVETNEFFCIIGPSGCGKSTLLKIVAGFEKPSSGVVTHNGVKIKGISPKRAMVFQDDAVFPWLTVQQNVEYGLKVRGIPIERRRAESRRLIDLVGLTGFEALYPKQLSGGMRKRVDIARALANQPQVLLMDEPFGALDAMTKEMLQVELTRIWESEPKTVLFITHDVEEALFLGDRVAIMPPHSSGGTLEIVEVPFKRPRDVSIKEDPEFQRMRRQLILRFEQFRKSKAS